MTSSDRPAASRWLYLVGAAFAVVGIGLLAGGLFLFRSTSAWVRNASSAPGRVLGFVQTWSEGEILYFPVVVFETADARKIEFRSTIGGERPSYQVNDPVDVLYDPRRPEEATIRSMASLWLAPVVLTAVGLGFVGITTAFSVLLLRDEARARAEESRREETAARLRTGGRKLTLRVDRVFFDTRSSRDGRHPYRIACRWHGAVMGRTHVFESESIWFNPRDHVRATIDVYIQPGEPEVYVMDTSFLPRLSET